MHPLQTIILVLAASAVAVADVLLRKTHAAGSLQKALTSPFMLGAVVLYLFQIIVFVYLFTTGARLVHVGVLQTVLYAAITIFAGIFIFGETLTTTHLVGVILAFIGVALIQFT